MKQIVKVRFVERRNGDFNFSPKEYVYIFKSEKSEKAVKVKEGDFAVIETIDKRYSDPFSIVKVTSAENFSAERINEIEEDINAEVKSKDIFGKADLSSYFAEKERQEKIRQININLANRFKEAEKFALYKRLAESDSIMKDLLAQLEALGGSLDVEDLTNLADFC